MSRKIGALWYRKNKTGGSFYSGQITVGGRNIKILVSANNYKEESKHPDLVIFEDNPMSNSVPVPQNFSEADENYALEYQENSEV